MISYSIVVVRPIPILHSKTENQYFSSCSSTGTSTQTDPDSHLRALCSPKFLPRITVNIRSLFPTIIGVFLFHLIFPLTIYGFHTLKGSWKTFQPFNSPIYSLLIPYTELSRVTSPFFLSCSTSTKIAFKPVLLTPHFSLYKNPQN